MRKVDITGGEPTIYPKLKLLLRICSVLGFTETRINTNATINCDELAKIPGVKFQTSFHSPNRQDIIKFMGFDVLDKIVAFHQKHKDKITYTNVCINQYTTDVENVFCGIYELSGVRAFNLKSIDYEHEFEERYAEHKYGYEINESIRRLFSKYPDARVDTTCFPFCFFDDDIRGNVRYGTDPVAYRLNPMHQTPFIGKRTPKWWFILYVLGIARRRLESLAIVNNYHRGQIEKTPKCEGCVCTECPGIKSTYLRLFGDDELRPIKKCPKMVGKKHCAG